MPPENEIINFFNIFEQSFSGGRFIRLTLGKPANPGADLKNVYIKPVSIKSQIVLSFVYRHQTKDITKNFPISEALAILKSLLGSVFLHAILFTQDNDIQVLFNKKRVSKIVFSKPTQSILQAFTHDHQKTRLISTEGNYYLQQLGLTNTKFEVTPKMQDKYRQINKYVELVDAMLGDDDFSAPFRVADMGSGKGYLTFGLYDHLVNNRKIEAQITGVEMRKDLVETCNRIARGADFTHLQFIHSNINDFDVAGYKMLIALHACDTATDDAIFQGIVAGAKFIVVAPCCQKQVRKSMQPPDNLKPILRHGIFAERQAELITDALRALILEKYGYQTKVFEFISTEHTPKNLMIFGVKSDKIVDKNRISSQIHEIKSFYGVENHYLEDLLMSYQQNVD